MENMSFYMIILLSYIIGGIFGFLACCLFSMSKIDILYTENSDLKSQINSHYLLTRSDLSSPAGRRDES